MVFYFTATGNSLYIAKQLDPEPQSIPQLLKKDDQELQFEDETIGIVYPNFGGSQPPVVRDFMKRACLKTDYLYMVPTYGFRAGTSADTAKELCDSLGLKLALVRGLFMVDNYLPNFDIASELLMDKKVAEQLYALKADIAARKHEVILMTEEEKEARRKHLEERRAKQAAERGGKPAPDLSCGKMLIITDACVGCGTCAKVCPEGDFEIEDGKSRHNGGFCMNCFACVHNCPVNAFRLAVPEKNPEARYRNPEVKLSEIIAANNQM